MALRDPDAGPELAALLGQSLEAPERDKARNIVAGSGAIDATVAAARLHADQSRRWARSRLECRAREVRWRHWSTDSSTRWPTSKLSSKLSS